MTSQDPGAPNAEWPNPQDGAVPPAAEDQPNLRSRRTFLRATIIASAAVAAAGAAVVMDSPLAPKFLSTIGVARAANSNPATCVTLQEAYHVSNPNSQLVITGTGASDTGPSEFPAGTCFTLTDSAGGTSAIMYGQIDTGSMLKAGTSNEWQMPIKAGTIQFFTTTTGGTCATPPNGTYPKFSVLCQAPCGLTCS